ncbi:MAG: glucosaminidase domain-containing protein [Bacteroidota bacterium]
MKKSSIFLWAVLCLFTTSAPAKATANTADHYLRQNYINRYQDIAIMEMNRSGIPASITLAQGIIESMWGRGTLALHSNNHFGIKCKSEWTGASYEHYDDDYDAQGRKIKSCFRVYDSPYDSYRDHTDFLTQRARYRVLFGYPRSDYRNWAEGLEQCGYATDPMYAEKLVRIIEENELYLLDAPQTPIYNTATVIELPNMQVNVQIQNPTTSETDYQPYENIYQEQLAQESANRISDAYVPAVGEREISVTPQPTSVSYEDIFSPQFEEHHRVEEEITPDIFATSNIEIQVEIPKPVIHYARSMNGFANESVIQKAPTYRIPTTSFGTSMTGATSVSNPTAGSPIIQFSDIEYSGRLQQAERGAKWGNTTIR